MSNIIMIEVSTTDKGNNNVLYNGYFNKIANKIFYKLFEKIKLPNLDKDVSIRIVYIEEHKSITVSPERNDPWIRQPFDFVMFDNAAPREKRKMTIKKIKETMLFLNEEYSWEIEDVIEQI
ncbi:MAG: hypothetical protein ACRBFS_15095 [Aureispira sp.]